MGASKCEKYALLIEIILLLFTAAIPMRTLVFISFLCFYYASVGGATDAYGSRFVYVCMYLSVCPSVRLSVYGGRISRRSLKTKH